MSRTLLFFRVAVVFLSNGFSSIDMPFPINLEIGLEKKLHSFTELPVMVAILGRRSMKFSHNFYINPPVFM